jgi:hypothetical protein
MFTSHLYCAVFLYLYILSLLHESIPAIRHHDPASLTGLEIFSLPDPAVQILSCVNATQESSMFLIASLNVYVIFSFSNVQTPSHTIQRNATAKEKRGPNSATSTSRHPNGNATQQSTGAQAQTSSQTQATILTSSTALPVTNTTSHTNPHATIGNAGRWTRFWLFFCCTSPKYTHDHH